MSSFANIFEALADRKVDIRLRASFTNNLLLSLKENRIPDDHLAFLAELSSSTAPRVIGERSRVDYIAMVLTTVDNLPDIISREDVIKLSL